MNFGEAIQYGFKNYANFSGVVRRSIYWYWYLFTVLVSFGLNILQAVVAFGLGERMYLVSGLFSVIIGMASLALFIPSLALMIRRLRDAGYSPLYLLLWLAPLALAVVFAIIGAIIGAAASSNSMVTGFVVLGSALAGAGIGAILGGAAAGIWLIVLLAQPTKTRAQGNKYALI